MQPAEEHGPSRSAELARRFEAIAPVYGFMIRAVLQEQSDGERLTIPQFRTMQTLQRLGGEGATNLDLARRISVSPPAMTAMIDGLVERELVTRTTDPENRRQVLILLTEFGHECLATAMSALEERLAQGMGRLSDEESVQLDTGLAILKKVFDQLRSDDEV